MAGIGKKYPKIEWQDADFKWNQSPENSNYPRYTWDEVELIQHAAGDDWTIWEDQKKKRLVKLILKIHGNTITESKKREIKQYKIKAKDIKLAVKSISGAKMIAEDVSF